MEQVSNCSCLRDGSLFVFLQRELFINIKLTINLNQKMTYKQRQLQLYEQLEAMSVVCFVCLQSEQKIMCEMLLDNSKCKRDICVVCYKKHKNDPCQVCAQKIEQHYKKGKVIHKSSMFDEANKMYNRQFKIRSNQQFQTLDFDFINLMTYYNAHPQVSVRRKFEEVQKQTRKILQNKKKDQRTLITVNERIKQAKILGKNHQQSLTGLQSCGYNRRYDKGINILRVGWGYPALTNLQFTSLSHLMKTHEEQNQSDKEQQIAQLKLNKKLSSYQPYFVLLDDPIQQQEQQSNSQLVK